MSAQPIPLHPRPASSSPALAPAERAVLARHLDALCHRIGRGRRFIGDYRNTPGYWIEARDLDVADDEFYAALALCNDLVAALRAGDPITEERIEK